MPTQGMPSRRAASTWLVPAHPGQVGRPGGEEAGLRAVAPPRAEVVDRPTCRRLHDPGGLRGDQRRIAERCEQDRLDPLRLRQGGLDPKQGLPGEDDRPLGDRPDVPLEAEVRQRVEETRVDPIERGKAADGLRLLA